MGRNIAIDVVELLLARRVHRDRNRYKIAIAAQGVVDCVVVDWARVFFDK